jgi:hypothetical protein
VFQYPPHCQHRLRKFAEFFSLLRSEFFTTSSDIRWEKGENFGRHQISAAACSFDSLEHQILRSTQIKAATLRIFHSWLK